MSWLGHGISGITAGLVYLATAVGCAGPSVPNPPEPIGHVYLLRGQGWVFSGGWGTLTQRLRSANLTAEDLSDYGRGWLVADVLERRKSGRLRGPVILVGHSRGGRQATDAAADLAAAGVRVELLLTVDVAFPAAVPPNVARAVNVYMTAGRVYPAAALTAAQPALTAVENVDLDGPGAPLSSAGLTHLNITDSPAVQEYLFRRILAALSGQPGTGNSPR